MRRAAGCITEGALLAGALLALAGCRSEAPGPPALDVPAQGLRCELLLPPELRDAMLPGAQLSEERPCATCAPVCSLRVKGPPETLASVAYDCRPRVGTDYVGMLQPTLSAGGQEVPALGRAAARTSPAPGMLQVVSFDDDTPCSLVVTWLGAASERAVELSRLALQAATHDSVLGIAPPPPLQFLEDAGTGTDAGSPDAGPGEAGGGDAGAGAAADAGATPLPRPRRRDAGTPPAALDLPRSPGEAGAPGAAPPDAGVAAPAAPAPAAPGPAASAVDAGP